MPPRRGAEDENMGTGTISLWVGGLFLLGCLPFVALGWWAATATTERVAEARRRRRSALGRNANGADTDAGSLERELVVWKRSAPALVGAGILAGSLLGWQVYRLFETLE